MPDGVEKVKLNGDKYYYFGGVFYVKSKGDYKVVTAPDGIIISSLPEGGKEVEIDGKKYVVYNNTYYQPLTQKGENKYQVISVEVTNENDKATTADSTKVATQK